MEIKQMEFFIVLCKELHFTRAANKLNISQPSLSQQIRILESEIGEPLFNRIGKKISLTETGNLLLQHTQNILQELRDFRQAVDDLHNMTKGELHVGALLTVVTYLLPFPTLKYNNLFPKINLNISGLSSKNIQRQLIKGELDLGISMREENDNNLEFIPLFTEGFSLAVPLDHELASYSSISIEVLKNTNNILLPNTYLTRRLLNEYCYKLGFKLEASLEMTVMESLMTMVEKGLGVSVLATPYLEFKQSSKIKNIPFSSPAPTREIGIYYVKDKYMSYATQKFLDELVKYSRDYLYCE